MKKNRCKSPLNFLRYPKEMQGIKNDFLKRIFYLYKDAKKKIK